MLNLPVYKQVKPFKKILVMGPVLVAGFVYAYLHHFQQLHRTGNKRLSAFIIAAALMYAWVLFDSARRRQDSFAGMIVQSSFYVYVFCVLTLTGYFVFFSQVSAQHWWQQMMHRVDTKDGVNLTPLLFLKARHLLTYDVVGNFVMLLPLGIYLPLLYRSTSHFFTVTLVAMLVAISIELMQLVTNFRITDIDDAILNTAGASLGFIIFLLVKAVFVKPAQTTAQQYQATL